jgi:hypothetical protein
MFDDENAMMTETYASQPFPVSHVVRPKRPGFHGKEITTLPE